MQRAIAFLPGLIVGACLLFPPAALAERANIMLSPPLVMMDDKNPYARVVLKNPGNASGNYTVELVDMQMLENGSVTTIPKNETAPYSMLGFLHVLPRSMTLKPGESKKLQLVLRKPAALEDGEYRAHLKVRLVDENSEGGRAVVTDKTVTVAAKMNLVVTIPVIFRHGKTNHSVKIDAPRLSRNATGNPALDMYLLREGNRSARGDITVTHISPDGTPTLLKNFPGVPVYRPTPRRFISVPLDVPGNINLSQGSLKISYSDAESKTSKILAEETLRLP